MLATTGAFGNQFLVPFSALTTLLALIGTGLWSSQLSGHNQWRVPAAALVGSIVGTALPQLDIVLHFGAWVLPGSVAALGFLIALDAVINGWIAMVLICVAFGYHGQDIGPSGGAALGWAGFGAGTITAIAAGIGFDTIIVQATSGRVVRLAGGAIAVVGGWLFYRAFV